MDELSQADAMIIPGVGSFGSAMNSISGYEDVIREHVRDKKPLLGICLGLHILFEDSSESEDVKGLGFFEGHVQRFNLSDRFKIPHMGWNRIETMDNIYNNTDILEGVDGEYMYFVHSYHIMPDNPDIVTSYTDYGGKVPVSVGVDNISALQFHPEKSGKPGLKILSNFVDSIN